jgi:hypothetical protein
MKYNFYRTFNSTVLYRYVGEQPTTDRDMPVASFSGNGGHRERDRCLRRQQDKYFFPSETDQIRDFYHLSGASKGGNTGFVTFPAYSQGQEFFSVFFRQCHDFSKQPSSP